MPAIVRRRPACCRWSSAAATRRGRSGGWRRRSPARPYTVGITGSPGAGKSTLTSAVDRPGARRRRPRSPCWPIDPSSPFTGGAILGDRVRMQDHATDDGRVHPLDGHARPPRRAGARRCPRRSGCSTRSGTAGAASRRSASVRSRWRWPGEADTTVVVVNPGWGDSVQANKAGLMEIADVFAINKADRGGVEPDPPRPGSRCSSCRGRSTATVGSRRSCAPWRPPATASTSCGGRSPTTAPTSRRRASSRGGGRPGHARSCAASSGRASRRGRGRSSATRRGPGSPTASRAASSTPGPAPTSCSASGTGRPIRGPVSDPSTASRRCDRTRASGGPAPRSEPAGSRDGWRRRGLGRARGRRRCRRGARA